MIGYNIGLYGSEVVNAVMVVVAVSLVVTTIATNRFARQIPPPVEERRRTGETILVPVLDELDGLAEVLRLGQQLAEPAGGLIQPLVPVTSVQTADIAASRTKRSEVDRVLRELGGDAETLLRVNRSVSAGLNQAAIEIDASLLLLGWPGPDDLRTRMIGGTYDEIIAATSVPVAIAALHPDTDQGRIVLYSTDRDLAPGNLPTMTLALEIATTLSRHRDQPLIIGPITPPELNAAGLRTPPTTEHHHGTTDLDRWASDATRPGDLLVIPIHDPTIGQSAIRIHHTHRSVLAINHNPETSSTATASPMNLPIGRTLST